MRDRNGLEIVPREECLRLLATGGVGRVALSVGAMPVILPVNFAVLDDDVVLRTGAGSKLDVALAGTVVAFEVDEGDNRSRRGWSVLVQGFARLISAPADVERATRLGLRPWAGGANDNFVRISSEVVTGRRLVH